MSELSLRVKTAVILILIYGVSIYFGGLLFTLVLLVSLLVIEDNDNEEDVINLVNLVIKILLGLLPLCIIVFKSRFIIFLYFDISH